VPQLRIFSDQGGPASSRAPPFFRSRGTRKLAGPSFFQKVRACKLAGGHQLEKSCGNALATQWFFIAEGDHSLTNAPIEA